MPKTMMSVTITDGRNVLQALAEIAEAEGTNVNHEVSEAIHAVNDSELLTQQDTKQAGSSHSERLCIFGLDDEALGKVTRLTINLPLTQAEIVRRAINTHIRLKLVNQPEEHARKLAAQRNKAEETVDRIFDFTR